MTVKARKKLGPIELEVIIGTVRSAELEIEAAVERTSRSPMIRDQHDYRVALFDARGRKLTGRSYSALVEPVFEYFDENDIHPGDVFFWNDPYNSCGGIGHVPDLCTTVPIFYDEQLIGFSQVFGHHDDVGGSVPGSLPVHAEDMWTEGLAVPPIKLYEAGKLNEAAYKIISRNSRLSDHLEGDIDAEIRAALLGSQRISALAERYGVETINGAFDQIIKNCADILRQELLPKIENGVYSWEDYIENDGVDEPRLHAFRLTMTKTDDKIILDFNGTDPESKGPLNWAIDYNEGVFIRKFMAPVLRSLADTPERAAEIDINEGILDVIEARFPPKGTLVSPTFGRPTGSRTFLFMRVLGVFAGVLAKATNGRMPADHETLRLWGLVGGTSQDDFYLFREVLGGGGPGRPWADGSDVVHIVPNSRNLPAEFSETRYPLLVERLALRTDSSGAGYRRGGSGYDKQVRTLKDGKLLTIADRTMLGCCGVNGGMASCTNRISVEELDGSVLEIPGMSDTLTVKEGAVIRVESTGGGGWGDPLLREPHLVCYDVECGIVSLEAAKEEYGVVLKPTGKSYKFEIDEQKTLETKARIRKYRGQLPLYDRGRGFNELKKTKGINRPEGWADPDKGWYAYEFEPDTAVDKVGDEAAAV